MPSSFPSALKSAIQRTKSYEICLELYLKGGTYKFSGVAVMSDSGGMHFPGLKFNDYAYKLGFPAPGLTDPRTVVSVQDSNGRLQKEIGGRSAGLLRGLQAKILMRSSLVSSSDHYTLMDGFIKEWRQPSPNAWEFTITPDNSVLRLPMRVPPIDSDIWERKPSAVADQDGRVLLGEFLSPGVDGARGMVPCILVDEEQGLWYVSYAIMTDLQNAYLDNAPVTLTTDGSGDFDKLGTGLQGGGPYIHGGRPYTLIKENFASVPQYDSSNALTVDVIGPEKQGDGSDDTTLLDDPAQMLRVALANWVYNDYPIGAPSPNAGSNAFFGFNSADANSPLDDTSFDNADAKFQERNETASMVLTSSTIAETLIKQWSDTFGVPVGWNSDNKLHTAYIDLFPKQWEDGVTRLREDQWTMREKDFSSQNLVDEVVSSYDITYARDLNRGLVLKHLSEDIMVPRRARRRISLAMEHLVSKAIV